MYTIQHNIDVDATRINMCEKAEYAGRCFERMRAADKQRQTTDVQDHFWSFLSASHLVWFYFNRWVGSKKTARALSKHWQSQLEPAQLDCWIALRGLRNSDVHIEPVATRKRTDVAAITVGGKPLTIDGAKIAITTVVYEVEWNDKRLDAFDLCRVGLELLDRFIAEFDGIRLPR